MKSAGKARSNGLYRHIRTSKDKNRNLLNDYINNLIICKFLIIFYHLGIKEANLSLTLTKINVKNEKTGLLFLYWAVTITVQIENNFKNAVSK